MLAEMVSTFIPNYAPTTHNWKDWVSKGKELLNVYWQTLKLRTRQRFLDPESNWIFTAINFI
jgi:hypothetical protein